MLCGTASLQLLAVVMSAALHDFEHPGYNNHFAVRLGLETAKLYNDQSVWLPGTC